MINGLVLTFIAGLVIGSFLNVLIFRIDDLYSVLKTRSRCPNCQHQLRWYDLFPLVSFLLLQARCRYCKKLISWQYPLVEMGTAILFVLLLLVFGPSWNLVFYALLFSILTVVFVYDLKTEYVPEEFVWAALIIAALGSWFFGSFGFASALLGAIIGGAFFAIMVIVSKEKWMGAGDIKVGVIMGLMVGYPKVILGLFTSFILGAIVGLIYMCFKKKTMKDSLPFTPFLILSILLCLLFGDVIINWYLGQLSLQ